MKTAENKTEFKVPFHYSYSERLHLAKFKISYHKLMIEVGKYQTDHDRGNISVSAVN